ncbi:transcriptional regulator [Streptomyces sp. AGS-58]|uniref:transcriptional regulator n=1 Tax=unclassified Streptomyces TaxID=2593676 RepID=UPI0035A29B58
MAAAREVIAPAEDESLDHHLRLGAAARALPRVEGSAGDDPAVETARRSVEALPERLGRSCGTVLDLLNPTHRRLVDPVAGLARLGRPRDTGHVPPYGRPAAQPAVTDLDIIDGQPTRTGQTEAAVAPAVLCEPVLPGLRRTAHAREPARRR